MDPVALDGDIREAGVPDGPLPAAFYRTMDVMADKTARLDLRLTHQQRDLLEQAASATGSTLAGYAVTHLMEAASATVARARSLVLDERSWEEFVAALDAPDDAAFARVRDMTPVWEQ